MSADVYDLIIIGADSAGLSAGIYAGRKKMKALILSKKFGGQSLYASNVENYPGFESISGANLMVKFRKQVEKYGTTIKDTEEVLEVGSLPADKAGSTSFIVTTKENKYESKTVIIATGASWKKLNIRWISFFIFVAILNEIVWRTQCPENEHVWVNFKVWALLPISFIFAASQVPLINKYKLK